MKIGGQSGDAKGVAVLEPLAYTLISPQFMAKITWSGRAGKGQGKKIALQSFANLVRFMYVICQKAERCYTHDSFLSDLKYKVIEYAHSKHSNANSAQSSNNEDITP